ncbi:MAG: sigma-70 family RNA polymerase sigma factor [Spirulina sp. SIO3F2]|nr:sigma-70 family RNA polymerase sigma factor [Spirulina sp. SIO3F2]
MSNHVLDMYDLEDELRALVNEAQRHPIQSTPRRNAIDRLYRTLSTSGRLTRPSIPQHLSGSYNEIYNIALQHLFSYLYQNIEKYNPERGAVLQWVNYLLKIRFPDAIREVTRFIRGATHQQVQRLSLDDLPQGDIATTDLWNSSGVPTVAQHADSLEPTAADVLDFLTTDQTCAFQQTHVQGHPQANFQFIALRYLEGHSWKEISIMLEVPIPTLSSFYQRSLKKFIPLFQAHLAC